MASRPSASLHDDTDAFSLDGERRALERLIDRIMAHLDEDPAMHVYHYGANRPPSSD